MKWLISIFDAFFFDQFGKFSVSKFWSNFGMCVATYIIVVQAKTVSVELLLVYLIVLTGNHALIFWFKTKIKYWRLSTSVNRPTYGGRKMFEGTISRWIVTAIGGVALPLIVVAMIWCYNFGSDRKQAEWDEFNKQQTEALVAAQNEVIKVTKDQQKITSELSHDYQTKIADLRKRYDVLVQLRSRANTASNNLPGLPNTAGRSDANTDENGLSECQLGLNDRYIASAQAEQLKHLQDWVNQQLNLRKINKDDGPKV